MNLYLLSQTDVNDYDTYDSCVVVAKSAAAARKIAPGGDNYDDRSDNRNSWHKDWFSRCWTADPEKVTVTLIGKAARGQKENTVVIASFNAG
jgi:hypothetical protein